MRRIVLGWMALIAFSSLEAQPAAPLGPEAFLAHMGKSPKSVIQFYKNRDPANAADIFTLALAYYSEGEIPRALDLANNALGRCGQNSTGVAVCWQLVSQCHGGLGNYILASEAASAGLVQNPSSVEMASLRVAYSCRVGYPSAVASAKDYLMQIDPIFGKHPKIDQGPSSMAIYAKVKVVALLPESLSPGAVGGQDALGETVAALIKDADDAFLLARAPRAIALQGVADQSH